MTDPRTWSKAFALFLAGKTHKEISATLGMSVKSIEKQSSKAGWSDHRAAIQKHRRVTLSERFKAIQEEHLEDVARKHLAIAGKFEEHISRGLDKKKVGARTLKDLSSSFVNSAGVAAKIVGIDKLSSAAPAKPTLIQFNMQVNRVSSGMEVQATVTEAESPWPAVSTAVVPALSEPDPF